MPLDEGLKQSNECRSVRSEMTVPVTLECLGILPTVASADAIAIPGPLQPSAQTAKGMKAAIETVHRLNRPEFFGDSGYWEAAHRADAVC